ncbi:MAG: dehypoxanthine futalosine cyclase [Chloroflexaceae bacterium]|nr:dehypoxanthine futalosine cyclase [Chloroflexaceae bacterium]
MPDPSVSYLLEKAAAGERLYFEEGLTIYRQAGLLELGMAARAARQLRVPGNIVTYLVDRNINYTNVCVTNCQFCGFYRSPHHPEAYVTSREELSQKIEELIAWGGTRILLQGGHHPDLPLTWYTDLLRWLRETYPTIERDCFSPSEIANMAKLSGLSVREVLNELQDAGLQGLPGSGAEILDDEIRHRFSPKKLKTDSWLSVMREAQTLGLNTSATMVIGFDEQFEHRMRHLQRIRDLQDYSLREHGNGFIAFISWTLQYSELVNLRQNTFKNRYGLTPHDYLRHAAVARLFLDNVLHHQVSWVTQGPKVGQVALEFGLDDFGSTMLEENVVAAATHGTRPCMLEEEIHELIRNAGYVPAKRDTSYGIVRIFDADEMEMEDEVENHEDRSLATAVAGVSTLPAGRGTPGHEPVSAHLP